jgi:hypothetical protein
MVQVPVTEYAQFYCHRSELSALLTNYGREGWQLDSYNSLTSAGGIPTPNELFVIIRRILDYQEVHIIPPFPNSPKYGTIIPSPQLPVQKRK